MNSNEEVNAIVSPIQMKLYQRNAKQNNNENNNLENNKKKVRTFHIRHIVVHSEKI